MTDNCNELQFEIANIWRQKKVIVIPIVIGALGTVSTKFESWVKMIGVDCPVELLQKACLYYCKNHKKSAFMSILNIMRQCIFL